MPVARGRVQMPNFKFENDSLQKKSSPFIWTKNASIQTKNCVAAVLMMVSIVFVSLVRQVWPPLSC